MKEKFSYFLPPSDQDWREMWNKGIFVFDANSILNIYKYKETAVEDIFKVLEDAKIKGRIFLPWHAANEFFNNRLSVINEQAKVYDDFIECIKNFQKN
ncbi:PIN-like domain-containing protein [Aminobacterium sp. MB27-C1]|uniref:PIN-like domain-containing protein n=1 Tax=Aminobacterium sp. MB27-C1 TaxID=3070661 RepID=UPI0027DD61E1|nr:PIN-like domain-containing protein [Aminobacterium sp. MB27-C1]WMI72158.1 PIN-like domain-containing protein [Aminobacterium sp. MB27-C1]